LTQTLPNEPLKLSMRELSAIIGMLSAMNWNAVRNQLESLSAIAGIRILAICGPV